MYRYLVLLLAVMKLCFAVRLLTNGDFEQPLTVGWNQHIGTPYIQDTIDRQTYFNPDSDYEARVKKYEATHAILFQTVNVPTTDIQFSVFAKLYARELDSASTNWSAATITLRYLDNDSNLLGETRIVYKSPHCPLTNSSTVHLIEVPDTNNWYNYTFVVADELNNLPGVNPSNIKKVQVALLDTTIGC